MPTLVVCGTSNSSRVLTKRGLVSAGKAFKLRLLLKLVLIMVLITPLISAPAANAEITGGEAARSLPDKIGAFRAKGSAFMPAHISEEGISDEDAVVSYAERTYSSPNGNTFVVYLARTIRDSAAYALLTSFKPANADVGNNEIQLGVLGTASISGQGWAAFFRGNTFVKIFPTSAGNHAEEITSLAQELAQGLDHGVKDIPVLVKHLPDWEKAQPHASYLVSLQRLKGTIPNQAVLDAVSFLGGAEAVVADYDRQKLLIIEFNTASLATDNDQRIRARLEELRNQGQPMATAYRRVGNYAVFVFDAPSQEAANRLIDQVKYQQVVQWLGEDPFVYERATREFTETTLGVFVSVVKASGLALISCLAVGGFFGALLFSLRRSQQRAKEAYSDSDAMLRLNLDELTPESDPARLLGRGH